MAHIWLNSLQATPLLRIRVAPCIGRTVRSASTTSEVPIYDVICVGGGPAGLSLLTALPLIETHDLTGPSTLSLPPGHYSNRASSLTPSSKNFLEKIGAWDSLDKSRIQPYHNMQVWDGITGSRISFDWQEAHPESGNTTIAYMTENDNLSRALLARLSSLGGTDLLHSTKVSNISLGPPSSHQQEHQEPNASTPLNLSSYPHLTLSTGSTLAARLLIGADGPSSPVRAFAGIGSSGWDYDRHGLVATLRLATEPDTSTAYQRFLPTGPIALLPLPGPFTTLVWSTTPRRAAHLKSLSPPDFAALVDAAFRLSAVDIDYMHTISTGHADELSWRLQHTPQLLEGAQIPHRVAAVQEGSIASFPLRLRHADTYATHRVALVGDAAHTIHPLAGQGLNMGLADVESLVGILRWGVERGMDVGDQLTLERYNTERYGVNHGLLGVVDKLHKLYSWGGGPVVGLRSWGLRAVDGVPGLKGWLMSRAAGSGA
ncbi:MAG: hypothetical protein LQ340_004234 [Diploschistes diacapsis]|nr:MAG: hypothetical protein LQ340_004234 [Diploschistes diacapsis]